MPRDAVHRRRLAVLGAAIAAVVVVAVVLAARGGSGRAGDRPIDDATLRAVPAGALVAVHLSTDGGRDAVRRATALAARFPGYPRLRANLLRRLAAGGRADVRPWLGADATLALLDSASGTAGSLVVLAVRDESKARAFVARGTTRGAAAPRYHGVVLRPYGATVAALTAGRLLLGQPESVRAAIDVVQGRARGLTAGALFRRARAGLPRERVADAYVTAGGVHRLLAPAGGTFALAALALDRPGLRAAALALTSEAPGARIAVHTLARPATGSATTFVPALPRALPAGVIAYLGVKDITRSAARLAGAAGAAGGGGGIAALLTAARVALAAPAQRADHDALLGALRGEGAAVILAHRPAPILAVVAAAPDTARVGAALAPALRAMTGALRNARVDSTRAAGVPVARLRVGSSLELDAAAFGGHLVLSTSPDGIAVLRRRHAALAADPSFRAVTGPPGVAATSLVFGHFDQLLKLGEQTGLLGSRAYLAARGDLLKVAAVGLASSGGGGDTTAQVRLQIP